MVLVVVDRVGLGVEGVAVLLAVEVHEPGALPGEQAVVAKGVHELIAVVDAHRAVVAVALAAHVAGVHGSVGAQSFLALEDDVDDARVARCIILGRRLGDDLHRFHVGALQAFEVVGQVFTSQGGRAPVDEHLDAGLAFDHDVLVVVHHDSGGFAQQFQAVVARGREVFGHVQHGFVGVYTHQRFFGGDFGRAQHFCIRNTRQGAQIQVGSGQLQLFYIGFKSDGGDGQLVQPVLRGDHAESPVHIGGTGFYQRARGVRKQHRGQRNGLGFSVQVGARNRACLSEESCGTEHSQGGEEGLHQCFGWVVQRCREPERRPSQIP